jgi:hypothetical protein
MQRRHFDNLPTLSSVAKPSVSVAFDPALTPAFVLESSIDVVLLITLETRVKACD